jgi:hypothetical protein
MKTKLLENFQTFEKSSVAFHGPLKIHREEELNDLGFEPTEQGRRYLLRLTYGYSVVARGRDELTYIRKNAERHLLEYVFGDIRQKAIHARLAAMNLPVRDVMFSELLQYLDDIISYTEGLEVPD